MDVDKNQPALLNCPKASSIKYNGLPTSMRTQMYGIRNAPPPFS